jgi:membrane-bound serine protease (ClpP class)
VAFVIGAILMFPGKALSLTVVAAAAAASVLFFLVVLATVLRTRRRAVVTGAEALIGAEGEVVSWLDAEGRVRVLGEIWRARSSAPLAPGTRVKVIDREGLTVVVDPASAHYPSPHVKGSQQGENR